MKIDLAKLNVDNKIYLDDDFIVDLEKYQNKEILDLKNMHVKGSITYNILDNLEVDLVISGIMVLRDSVTLEPIEKDLDVKIEEEYSLEEEIIAEYYEKEQNVLDIMAILWENIVLEVPISLTKTKNLEMSGEGWTLGEKVNNEKTIDPRLAKLEQLLDKGKES